MAYEQIGTPIQLVVGTPSLTITDVMEMECDPDPGEVKKHYGGTSRYARATVGPAATKLKIKTSDASVLTTLVKSMEVINLTATWQAPWAKPSAATGTAVSLQHSKTLTYTLTGAARVMSAIKLSGKSPGGDPAEYEIEFEPMIRESDGSAPTEAWTLA